MARAPRASVSKTSGQGVSRRAYQSAYRLGQHGSAASGLKAKTSVDGSSPGGGSSPKYGPRNYGKGETPHFNVSYGDTMEPGDLADIMALGEGSPPRKARKK